MGRFCGVDSGGLVVRADTVGTGVVGTGVVGTDVVGTDVVGTTVVRTTDVRTDISVRKVSVSFEEVVVSMNMLHSVKKCSNPPHPSKLKSRV